MTDDDVRWLTSIAYRTVSLTFVWVYPDGYQFVFMPGETYPWWNDDDEASPLYQAPEGYGGDRGRAH